jgi:hypothetical protein
MRLRSVFGPAALAIATLVALPGPAAGQFVRLSVSTAGVEANGASAQPAIDDSGRYVAFRSAASNLVAGDTNGVDDIFVRDRDTDADGVFDEPGAVATTRVSVARDGAQANAGSDRPAVAAGGRFVVFLSIATNLVGPALQGTGIPQVYRHDRSTGETILVSVGYDRGPANAPCEYPDVSADGRFVVFTSRATNLTTDELGVGGGVFLADLATGELRRISPTIELPPQPPQPGGASDGAGPATISADGARVAFVIERHWFYRVLSGTSGRLFVYEAATGTSREVSAGLSPQISSDGAQLGYLDAVLSPLYPYAGWFGRGGWLGLGTGTFEDLVTDRSRAPSGIAWSPGGRFAAFTTRTEYIPLPNEPPESRPFEPYLVDRTLQGSWLLPTGTRLGPLDATGRTIAFVDETVVVPGDANGVADVVALDLLAFFDADVDGLDDRWEETMGLSTTSGAGADGPDGDPDGDGVSNRQERAQGTHPRGTHARYFAEGATGSFFDTSIALVNPGTTPAAVAVRFATDAGARATQYLRLPPLSRRTVVPEALVGLEAVAFSTIIDSDVPIVADRRMSWDASGYGGHAETSLAAPALTWFLAEGATGDPFSLFYLLQNPGATEQTAEIRFLRPGGVAPVVRTYTLAPSSRTTIFVDGVDPALASTDVSAAITASGPIIVERAMYFDGAGQVFGAGHASAGVTAASPTWFFAEGATGQFFELFLLLANPGTTPVTATVRYTTDDGMDLSKDYALVPESRRTIWVDEESFPGLGRALSLAAVSATVTASAPIVAERAMWWPGGQSWQEGHATSGTTATATRWVLADGGVRGPRNAKTYVLIANVSDAEATVDVTILPEVGGSETRTFTIPARRRFTIDVDGQYPSVQDYPREARFGVIVRSQGAVPSPLVVERAMYWDAGGVSWAAGTNSIGTPVP